MGGINMKPPKFIKNVLNQKWFIYTGKTIDDVSYYKNIIHAFATDDSNCFLFNFVKDDLNFSFKKPWVVSRRMPDREVSLSVDYLLNTYANKKTRGTIDIMLFKRECQRNNKVPVLMFFNKHFRVYIDLTEYKLLWYEKK